jgi:hypothetical protein
MPYIKQHSVLLAFQKDAHGIIDSEEILGLCCAVFGMIL